MMILTQLQALVSIAFAHLSAARVSHPTMAHKGQGLIEYAGAVVTSALMVGTLVKVAPHAYANMFGTVFKHVSKYVINIL